MSAIVVAVALLLAPLGSDAESALARLRALVAVSVVEGSLSTLAGQFASQGGLAGNELHLFPDGTYLYCEWADILPLTVRDRGRWSVAGGLVRLQSDPVVVWPPRADRAYIVVRRDSHASEALLVGLESRLPLLENPSLAPYVSPDPGAALLAVGLRRVAEYDARGAHAARARLLKSGWRPEYYQREQ